jgi:hypothetical protein
VLTEITSLNTINQLIVVMVKCSVMFEVQTEFLNIIYTSFCFEGLTVGVPSVPQFHLSAVYSSCDFCSVRFTSLRQQMLLVFTLNFSFMLITCILTGCLFKIYIAWFILGIPRVGDGII